MTNPDRVDKLLAEHHQRYPGLAVLDLWEIIRRIDRLLASKPTVRVAIDGFCGSGKSILQRAGPVMLERFIQEWIPMENRYFTAMNIVEQSDLVLCAKAP